MTQSYDQVIYKKLCFTSLTNIHNNINDNEENNPNTSHLNNILILMSISFYGFVVYIELKKSMKTRY